MAENKTTVEITGRKIFFINPSYKIKNNIIATLHELEYEVYTIENWRDVKNLLRLCPDSICFFGVDSQLPLGNWMAMIRTFQSDDVLSSMVCGLLTERPLKETREAMSAFNEVKLDAGVNTLNGNIETVKSILINIIESNKAKGRRHFVRCPCFGERDAKVFLTFSNGNQTLMHEMKILDISIATIFVRIPQALSGKLWKGESLPRATVVLETRQFLTDLVVKAEQSLPDGNGLAILVYGGRLSPNEHRDVRSYIERTLQKQLMTKINGKEEDNTDYGLLARNSKTLVTAEKSSAPKFAEKEAPAQEAAPAGEAKATESGTEAK